MPCQAMIPKHDGTATKYDTSLLAQVLTSRLMLCNHRASQRARAPLGHGKGPDWPQGKTVLSCNCHAHHHFCVACPPILHDEPSFSPTSALLNSRLDPHPAKCKAGHAHCGQRTRTRAFPHEDTPAARPCMHWPRSNGAPNPTPTPPPPLLPPMPLRELLPGGRRGEVLPGAPSRPGPPPRRPGHGRWKRGLGQGRSRPHAFDGPRTRPPGQGSRYHK